MRAIHAVRNLDPLPALPSDALSTLRSRAERARNRAQECDTRSMLHLRDVYTGEARDCESEYRLLLQRAHLAKSAAEAAAEADGVPHRWAQYLSEADVALVDQAAHIDALARVA